MGKVNNTTLSMEDIAFQSGRLFIDLSEAIGSLRKKDTYTTETINEADIPGIVRLHTKMRISFDVNTNVSYGAYIRLPEVDRNHPFMQDSWRQGFLADDTGAALIRALGGRMTGGVDRKNGRVSGIYTDIQGDVVFGVRLMRDKSFSNEELAAVLLHEVGHLFTYFEYLGTLVYTSHVIGAVAKSVYGIDSYDKRIDTLVEAEKVLGVDIDNKERIAATPNKRMRSLMAQSVLISTIAQKSRSDTGYNIYEMRSCEQLADQFTTRHGAGKDLVFALDKMYRRYWDKSTMNTAEYTVFECIKLILFMAGLFLFPITLTVYLLTANPTRKIYDDPEARVKLLKQQMLQQLKDKNIDAIKKRQILADIEAVELVQSTLDDKRSLMELFWTTIMPSGRAAMKQQEAQKLIEGLLNNELIVTATKFELGN